MNLSITPAEPLLPPHFENEYTGDSVEWANLEVKGDKIVWQHGELLLSPHFATTSWVGNSVLGRHYHPKNKETNQHFVKRYGVRVSTLKKYYNKVVFEKYYTGEFAKRLLPLITRYGGRVVGNFVHLNSLYSKQEFIEEHCFKDQLYHLFPLMVITNYTPKELKGLLGKGLWKKVCNNSYTRNMLLMKVFINKKALYANTEARDKYLVKLLKATTEVPSFLLKLQSYNLVTNSHWKSLKGTIKSTDKVTNINRDLNRYWDMDHDLKRMAYRLGELYNPEWSYKRKKEMHDTYSKAITAQEYSKEEFLLLPPVDTVTYDGYTATLLKSPYEIAEEGKEMRHCVAGYIGSIKNGSYLVYSIKDREGNRVSTLGITYSTYSDLTNASGEITTHPPGWRIQQHYGLGNTLNYEGEVRTLANMVVQELNDKEEVK